MVSKAQENVCFPTMKKFLFYGFGSLASEISLTLVYINENSCKVSRDFAVEFGV